jgi:hypothetical protein
MDSKELVNQWFVKWEKGDFLNLPISQNFTHTSPMVQFMVKTVHSPG